MMRSKIKVLVVGCALAAATVVPALACSYGTQASSEKPQQTAQAQGPSDTKDQ